MADDDKRAVVDTTDDPSKAQSDATQTDTEAKGDARDAKSELDDVLDYYRGNTSDDSKATNSEPKSTDQSDKSDSRMDVLERQLADLRFERDVKPVIEHIRGDVDPSIYTDKDIEGWLDREAIADPRLAAAWRDRHQNPAAFDKVKNALRDRLAERFSKAPDRDATEDREAVAAAVRGASTKAPEGQAPDFKDKSDAEFRNQVHKDFGFTPPV